jgi:hypothetical protein
VRDESGLERDDGAARGQRLAHLVGDADHAERSISTKRLSSPRPHLVEAGATVGPQRPLVPARDPETEGARLPLPARVGEPGLDERLGEAAPGQVGAHAEPEPHLVSLGDEVEEADELAAVVHDRPQVRAPGRVREQLDAPRVGRRVVPLVRELVPPPRDRSRLLVGDRLNLHAVRSIWMNSCSPTSSKWRVSRPTSEKPSRS